MVPAQIVFIFAMFINVVHANHSSFKPSARCNTFLADCVDEPSCRGFNNMKLIPLSSSKKGKNFGKYFAQVDDEMYPFLIHWNWRVAKMGKTRYAYRTVIIDGKRKTILMHRFILGIDDPKVCVDHKNMDGLCNFESNIRTCTKQQNGCNRDGWDNASSKYKGVRWISNAQKRVKRWYSGITVNRKHICLGYFHSEEEAAKAYDIAAVQYHGEFAKLNFPL